MFVLTAFTGCWCCKLKQKTTYQDETTHLLVNDKRGGSSRAEPKESRTKPGQEPKLEPSRLEPKLEPILEPSQLETIPEPRSMHKRNEDRVVQENDERGICNNYTACSDQSDLLMTYSGMLIHA